MSKEAPSNIGQIDLPGDLDTEYLTSLRNAPKHLGMPTRNHWAFLNGVFGINPAEEKIVVRYEYEYFYDSSDQRPGINGSFNKQKTERPLTQDEVDKITRSARQISRTEEDVSIDEAISTIRKLSNLSVSADKPIWENGTTTLADTLKLSDNAQDEVERRIDGDCEKDLLEILRSILEPRELDVILMIYGVGYDKPMSQVEAGKMLGVTRQRANQIKIAAFRKIRASKYVNDLLRLM